jgi:hypothetical protein
VDKLGMGGDKAGNGEWGMGNGEEREGAASRFKRSTNVHSQPDLQA